MAGIADTHRLITSLTQKGFSKEQAEGISDAINEIDFSALATKNDIEKLKLELTIRLATGLYGKTLVFS